VRFRPRLSWQALQKGRAVAWKLEVRLLRRGLPKGWGLLRPQYPGLKLESQCTETS
jgi:hypothetical protein